MNGRFSGSLPNSGGNLDDFFEGFDSAQTADDFATPVPVGKYSCIWRKGELVTARTGTPSYRLTFEIETGDHAGRKLWADIWLTPKSRELAKRDLAKLDITDPRTQLQQPIPKWLRCNVWAGLRTGDDGIERNIVSRFEVVEKITPTVDPFAPEGSDHES